MRNKLLALAVIMPAMLLAGHAGAVILAQSNFDFGKQGWSILYGEASRPADYHLHFPHETHPGGMLSYTDRADSVDLDNLQWDFSAPAGLWQTPFSKAGGGTLSFSLSQAFQITDFYSLDSVQITARDDPADPNGWFDRSIRVSSNVFPFFHPGFTEVTVNLDTSTSWDYYQSRLDASGNLLTFVDTARGFEITDVLSNFNGLFINGRFANGPNNTGFLDNVVLKDNTVLRGLPEGMLGLTQINPIMPLSNRLFPDDPPLTLHFQFGTLQNLQRFIDPEIAIGYDYIVNDGPNFASVLLPSIAGDDGLYEIYLWDESSLGFDIFLASVDADITYFFGGDGVDRFRVLGIDQAALLDPTDLVAFVTGLTFVSDGDVDMTMTPVTFDAVPEPGTLSLLGAGILGTAAMRRRKGYGGMRLG